MKKPIHCLLLLISVFLTCYSLPAYADTSDAKGMVKNYKGEKYETEWYNILAQCAGKIVVIKDFYQGATEKDKTDLINLAVVYGSLSVDRLMADRKMNKEDANLRANEIVNSTAYEERNSFWIWNATGEPNKHYEENIKLCNDIMSDYSKIYPDAFEKK